MRNQYQNALTKYFSGQLLRTRDRLGLSQTEMAGHLAMDRRSYVELEYGRHCCSAVTLVLYLLYCCEDPAAFLTDCKDILEREYASV